MRRWFLCFVSQRLILLQCLEFFSTCGENRCCRHSRIFAIWIRISSLSDLRINISGFIFLAEGFKAPRFEIARRKRDGRLLCSTGGTMEKRKRRYIVFIHERHLGEGKCRWSGEFTVAVVVEHFL